MQKSIILFFTFILLIFSEYIFGQNNRLNSKNTIGWYNYFSTLKLSNKIGLHAEYQWRRENTITHWQQGLLRVGVNYSLNSRVLFRAGYAWVETFPYGEYPINSFSKDFTEHRIFEMAQVFHNEGRVDFFHRFILEQRFIGRYTSSNIEKEDHFPLSNRIRYMIRIQIPLKGDKIKDKTPYIGLYDEIFVGFGKNVNTNVFDQNRLGVLFGYCFNKNLRIEAGYLNQILQFGRQINSQNVFQSNSGLIVNTNLNIDLTNNSKLLRN